jgi:L-serine dehydratase, iron-sulfur-dependent, beta subunit
MHIFDIMGPIMVGPSSSHTAGAVRIGRITRNILQAQPVSAKILLHGSFAATGAGHGTDRAIVAGLLGMAPDDADIPRSLHIAKERDMQVELGTTNLRGAHPNTAVLQVINADGRTLEVAAASLGGGRVRIVSIDGMSAAFTADYPTLIIRHEDKPGAVAEVSGILYNMRVNIAGMQLYRDARGGLAVMVIESDEPITDDVVFQLRQIKGFRRVVYLDMTAEGED